MSSIEEVFNLGDVCSTVTKQCSKLLIYCF